MLEVNMKAYKRKRNWDRIATLLGLLIMFLGLITIIFFSLMWAGYGGIKMLVDSVQQHPMLSSGIAFGIVRIFLVPILFWVGVIITIVGFGFTVSINKS